AGSWRSMSTGSSTSCRAALAQMLDQPTRDEVRGRMVIIGSQHGMIASPGGFAYGVSKAAVLQMMRQIAVEHAAEGILCNAVSPGKILTGKTGPAIAPEMIAYSEARTPLPRLGRPADVAQAVLFLADPATTFVTGHNLMVDGGWMAG
ncbi:SDR family NAD(P)-dependent oxidoreductase, partial [Oceanicola sp. S124]|uniref:SDR family NAD(P)-dependent oxidoreductase n=1 Tax=Oceanicola sp. S124 TaxID=1042378 RepID=UPI00110FB7D9